MNYWKLMAGRGSEKISEFLEQKEVRIGYAENAEAISDDLETVRKYVREHNPDASNGQVAQWCGQLHKFFKLHNGDRVLVYEPGTRLYHIAEVAGPTIYKDGLELPYSRPVKWIGTVNRDDLAAQSKNVLGGILGFFSINDEVVGDIERVLAGEKQPTTIDSIDEEISEERDEVAAKAKEFMKDRIQALGWEEMQELVAGLLRAMGYRTSVSPAGPDRGKDIVASPDGLGLEDPRIYVEVKHRKGSMGAPEIRSFVGGLRKAKGLYVSTGGFSKEAQYEAERSETPITLVDIDELARMIDKYYDQFDTEARAILPLKKIYWPL